MQGIVRYLCKQKEVLWAWRLIVGCSKGLLVSCTAAANLTAPWQECV